MRLEPKEALALAKRIQEHAPIRVVPPSGGTRSQSQSILPRALYSGTRGYIEKVSEQINGCYERGWFDSCAVMMRRLLETLIIETFEHHGLSTKIQNANTGDFYYLSDLVKVSLAEKSWNLTRNTRQALPRLKTIGDQSAHSRRFTAHREDVDKVAFDFRAACQEFLYLSGLK